MADSQRLRTTPDGLRMISTVAAELARRGDGHTSVLAATTYFPVDVDSVARVFEGLEELEGIDRLQQGPLTVYRIEQPDRFTAAPPDIDDPAFIDNAVGFMKAIAELKTDPDWEHRVRGQHELLEIIADSDRTEIELSYLTSRVSMSRARVQSLLNDFDAQGYIGVDVDEEVDSVTYQFPPIDYPPRRFDANMERLQKVEPPARSQFSAWFVLAAFAVVVLVVVILLRF